MGIYSCVFSDSITPKGRLYSRGNISFRSSLSRQPCESPLSLGPYALICYSALQKVLEENLIFFFDCATVDVCKSYVSEVERMEFLQRWGLAMSQQGTWVDDMFVNAVAQAYGVRISCERPVVDLMTK